MKTVSEEKYRSLLCYERKKVTGQVIETDDAVSLLYSNIEKSFWL